MRSLTPTLDSVDATSPFRAELASSLSFEQAALWLRGDRRPFALSGDWLGGLCVLGSEPVRTAGAGEDPFGVIEQHPSVGDRSAGLPAVGGGWVGWLGYGLGALVECLPPPPPAPVPRRLFSLAYYDHVLVFDGDRWWFEALWS